MERIGQVIAVHGDQLDVSFCRLTDCGKCHACMGSQKDTVIKVKGTAAVGDSVRVAMPDTNVLQASAAAYIIPLVSLIAGMYLGTLILPLSQDASGAIGAVIGLGLSIGVMALTEKKRQKNPKWNPQLIEVIPAAVKGEKENG